MMRVDIGTLSDRRVSTALAIHEDFVNTYKQAWNAHTFNFENDIGSFLAPDITIVAGDTLGGRSMLADLSEARADYVRFTNAIVTLDLAVTYVADLGDTAVVVAEGDFGFTYPDQTTYAQRLLASSILRILGGTWVFQHIHFGRGCA